MAKIDLTVQEYGRMIAKGLEDRLKDHLTEVIEQELKNVFLSTIEEAVKEAMSKIQHFSMHEDYLYDKIQVNITLGG